ncbi:MarR family winged helix-turn-helix transcriptional regulator [Streptomyces ipomoeae]|uniref:MarR family winged helix-turn-helix transcriptional regulator n=1 Tax=Streptomyces ipomoeae TaxID=103232 RepID=UPI0011479219|nr:MarR family transcriptional regulator [Streptomyces ipomoeae]TQE25864.1 MarR family transcriptional regulator [Streptomyces ipomoeae]
MTTSPRRLDGEERRAWPAYLSTRPDHTLSMSELAERLKITRSRLTHAVTRLQEAGYVDRREDPANRRNQLAVLTAEGQELLERAAPGHDQEVLPWRRR